MLMAEKRPPPFSPSAHAPEKRSNQMNVRLTDSELSLLDREARRLGVTTINLMRMMLREGLRRARRR